MEDFIPDEFTINYSNVAKQKNLCNVTRVLAMDLIENPYLIVGDFFKSLSDGSLEELVSLVNRDDDDAISETLLLSEMLSKAEGLTNSLEDMSKNIEMFRVLVAGTSLHRKGLIRAYFENMSFGADAGELMLFERINSDH